MGSLTLLEDSPLSPEQTQILRVASLCGEQLLVLINDVLDRAKLEEGKVELEMVPFALHELLADALDITATIAAQKGLGKCARAMWRVCQYLYLYYCIFFF